VEARGSSTERWVAAEGSDASRYPLALLARLVDAGLTDVVIGSDGMPTLQVDPVFERARAAALAGFADVDHARDEAARHLRPTG
jgi:hypothetical protein